MDIFIKELALDDLTDSLLEYFNRYQEVKNFYILENGEWILKDFQYIQNLNDTDKMKKDFKSIIDWDSKKKEDVIKTTLTNSIKDGGIVFGVFDEKNHLIAFENILLDRFGSRKQYIELKQIAVSYEYRNKGIGKELFKLCIKKAKEFGVEKIYISTSLPEETQIFYKRMGCKDAEEINKDIMERETYDRQMEYVINEQAK
jgi:N-acetylglutamate synthase-like GNAT family acetyltransferase